MPETLDEQLQERERRRDIAEGLRGILAVLNSNKPLDAILDYITLYACRLLEADAVAIYRLQPETSLLKIQSSHGLSREYLDHSSVTLGQGPTGLAVNQGKPIAITRVDPAMEGLAQPVDPQVAPFLNSVPKQFHSELSVPLIVKQDIVGALNLYYLSPRSFSQDDIDLAVSFCDQTALAIENARLREQAQQDAITAERNRLARELHDSVTQTIFSASLIADVLPTIWERNPQEAAGALEDLRKLTRGALAEMRTLLLELRPIGLGDVGLADLLRQLAEGVSGRIRAQIKVQVEGNAVLPTEVKLAFYRIAQESLNNVVKHSGADTVEIQIRSGHPTSARKTRRLAAGQKSYSEFVSMSIGDNGRGFDPKAVIGEHLGLGIMQERALNAQVRLGIRSSPGHGTEITLHWPMLEKRG